MKTLYADTSNGIMRQGDDSLITEIVSEDVFIHLLPILRDCDYIKCNEISEETKNDLQRKYGIH